MHCQRLLEMDGFECVWPGLNPVGSSTQAIHDWLTHGPKRYPGVSWEIPGYNRDFMAHICANRERHYRDGAALRSIDDLKPAIAGKKVVIVCPGPSLLRTFADGPLPLDDETVVLAINHAARAVDLTQPNHNSFIGERHALVRWLTAPNGTLLPGIPAAPLVTMPEASAWLADTWPVERRFYYGVDWREAPNDSRERFPYLCSVHVTPTMALDFAVRMGAERVVFLGMDFALDLDRRVYFDTPAERHPNAEDFALAQAAIGVRGDVCPTTHMLQYHRNIMEAMCYWVERTARIPCLNASDGGIFDWRPMTIQEALGGKHEPIVDRRTGSLRTPEGDERVSEEGLRTKVARILVPPALAGV